MLAGDLVMSSEDGDEIEPVEPGKPDGCRARRGWLGWLGWLAHPLPWLLAQAVALWWRCAEAGLLVAEREPDSGGYVSLAKLPLEDHQWLEKVLGAIRTYGYPLFLKMVGWGSPDYAAAPAAHLVCYILAILLFWRGFQRYSGRPWLAFWAVTPLFYAEILSMLGRITADSLAAAMAVASLGLLLWLARRPGNAALWLALVAAVTFTYHVRPAYLYMLPLVPLLGMGLRWLRPEERRLRWRWGVALMLAVALPFLAYSSLRWVVMDHFGLVSFGGYNLAGVATPLLDEALIAELPVEDQELGAAVLEKRREVGLETVNGKTPIKKWHDQYNRSVWSAAVPAARLEVRRRWRGEEAAELERHRQARIERKARLSGRQPTPEERAQWRERRRHLRAQREVLRNRRSQEIAALNHDLTRLAKSVLKRRSSLYLKWVFGGFGVGVAKAWEDPWVRWLGYGLLVLGAGVGGLVFRRLVFQRRRQLGPNPSPVSRFRWTWRSTALALVASSYFAAGLGLVVLVEVPFNRYMIALTLFLPSALLAALVEPWIEAMAGGGEQATAWPIARPIAQGSSPDSAPVD